jgi:tRNA G18 (ribose-2'-O)-methylase SpoU
MQRPAAEPAGLPYRGICFVILFIRHSDIDSSFEFRPSNFRPHPMLISSLEDPRIDPYRKLKDREIARDGGRFIAEGEFIVRRLLASDYPVESVLLAERRVAEIGLLVPTDVPVYVASNELLRQIIGYRFQSGVIAVGRRKPSASIDQIVTAHSGGSLTLVVCPETASAENLGSLIRISAGFGADAVVLGERCCDPFWRQAIRVSMGTVFSQPIVRSENLLKDLAGLRQRHRFDLVASVLDSSAEPLEVSRRAERIAILFGNEAQGLEPQYIESCDRRVTIPMRQGIDSLNVAVAAGIFLYHFTRTAVRQPGR